MLAIGDTEQYFAGVILLDCSPLQAECISLFAASSTENRLKHFQGYRGAAFFASLCGRFALEFVLWDNAAALATVKKNPVFSEHINIVEQYVKTLHVAFGSEHGTCGSDGISFARGERSSFVLYKPRTPPSLGVAREQTRSMAEFGTARALFHWAEDGTSVALLTKHSLDTSAAAPSSSTFGAPVFKDDFIVVESIPAPSDAERFPPPYRLSLTAA
jgi:hypothetical protein